MDTAANNQKINKNSSLPIHKQIAHILREKVQKSKEGAPLGSDRELAREYGISVFTVRQAMAQLVQEGLLRRVPGKGTFVEKKISLDHKFIGLVVPNIISHLYPVIIKAVEEYAIKHNFYTILCNANDDVAKEEEYVRGLVERNVAGIILDPVKKSLQNKGYSSLLREKNTPLVFVDVCLSADITADYVATDNVKGGYLATRCLIENGYKRLGAIVGPMDISNARERYDGYKKALAEYKIEPDESFVANGEYTKEGGYRAMKSLAEKNKSLQGIFISNLHMTRGALEYIKNEKYTKPLGMVTFDDPNYEIPENISLVGVIRQPFARIGEKAAETLLNRIRHNNDLPSQKILLPPKLVLKREGR